ncbi:hypothetical protein HANVADRAFT_5970 [Hanseniaspora valbyensis NRRL Y-1626]|uniref:Uncharacterized protein n=1 Tax=Hanseniaspora valbyensis NRRL Y-1626 TaxID=766949 RepID=A0A1B7TGS9_9ASCO|nr:hypothetical protein HANVADRAFT_5970 [Hanseniaspora valbyensis NRRL Y-1626]
MDPGFADLLSNKVSMLGYVNFYVEIEIEKIHGKPDHLLLDDWCEHQQELGHHFKLKKPAYDENNHGFSTFYRYKVYEILAQYTFISGCLNKDCIEKGTVEFVTNGFTTSRKNDGKLYKIAFLGFSNKINEQSDGNTNNNNNVNRENDNCTNNNENISVGNVGKDFTINNTVNSFVFYNNQINIPSLTEEE